MQDIPQDILFRAAQGNLEAFRMVYLAYCGFVYNVSYRIMHNREDAQEVTQDVFVKIYRKLGGFRFQSSLKTWLYRITVNTALNAYKNKAGYLARRVGYDEVLSTAVATEQRASIIDKENNEALIESMLRTLNPDQRACVILRDIEGLSYKEIAESLNININTVRSRLKRARETLVSLRRKGVITNEV